MKLLVDMGNQRVKWALAEDAAGLGFAARGGGAFEFEGAQLGRHWGGLPAPTSVWAACVASPEARRAVAQYARRAWAVQAVFIVAPRQQAGVRNHYSPSAALGGDRWAALVAAAAMYPRQPSIVVDAGTAVTVDLLDGAGCFRGGVIFPGIATMQAAMRVHAAGLGKLSGDAPVAAGRADHSGHGHAQPNPLATDTAAAVASGALLAVAGGVNLCIERQQRALPAVQDWRVLAAGGDGARIAPWLAAEVTLTADLVLRGLARISTLAAGRRGDA